MRLVRWLVSEVGEVAGKCLLHIDSLDGDLIHEFATVKEKWDQLQAKYSKVQLRAN